MRHPLPPNSPNPQHLPSKPATSASTAYASLGTGADPSSLPAPKSQKTGRLSNSRKITNRLSTAHQSVTTPRHQPVDCAFRAARTTPFRFQEKRRSSSRLLAGAVDHYDGFVVAALFVALALFIPSVTLSTAAVPAAPSLSVRAPPFQKKKTHASRPWGPRHQS